MSLCQYCNSIPAKLFSFRRDTQCSHDHQPNLSALKKSAAAGCRGCGLFLHAVESSTSDHAQKYAIERNWNENEQMRLSSTKFGWQEVSFGWGKAGVFRTFAVPPEWESFPVLDAGQQQDSSTYLLYEAELIKHWSKICLETHQCCSRAEPFLPTRLIDVGTSSEPKLRLVNSAEIGSSDPLDRLYLALSHCWGLSMPASARTVSSTLEQNMACIRPEDLPLTFQDFIKISRRLGVRYVWIDSLCIIQDSRSDWEHEAAQMASVYSSAHLTVAASGSSDGRGGCRVNDSFRSYGPLDISCPAAAAEGNSPPANKTFRLWSRDPFPLESVLATDPLTGRGWTLQERELSPRIVHYSSDTIRWECSELRATLEFPWGDHGAFDVGRLFDGGSSARPTTFGGPHDDGSKPLDEEARLALCWFELVQRYTQRSFTKQEDVLPAVAGIAATTLRGKNNDAYLAGLWRKHLGHYLVWACASYFGQGFAHHSRPASKYLAPSWSWASVKGKVEYLSWVNGYWHSFNPDPDPKYTPELVGYRLEPVSSDLCGAVKEGGYIKLKGLLKAALVKHDAGNSARPATTTAVAAVGGGGGGGSGGGDGGREHEDEYRVGYSGKFSVPERLDLVSPDRQGKQLTKVGEIRYDVPLCEDCCGPAASVPFRPPVWLLCCVNTELSGGRMTRTAAIALEMVEPPIDEVREPAGSKMPWFRRVGVAWGIEPEFWEWQTYRDVLGII